MVIPQHGQGNVAARAAEATGRAPGEPSLPAPCWLLTTRVSGERWGQWPYPPASDTHVVCTGVPLIYAAPPSATPLLRHPPATPRHNQRCSSPFPLAISASAPSGPPYTCGPGVTAFPSLAST